MQTQTIQILSHITQEFYQNYACDFSKTRNNAWQGWEKLITCMNACNLSHNECHASCQSTGTRAQAGLSVADIACGNMRLLDFLLASIDANEALKSKMIPLTYDAWDMEPALMDLGYAHLKARYDSFFGDTQTCIPHTHTLDIIERLQMISNMHVPARMFDSKNAHGYDLVCSFGFMHHIPSAKLRRLFIQQLAQMVAPQGILALSFWNFVHDETSRLKATHETQQAYENGVTSINNKTYALSSLKEELEENDWLLGWKQKVGVVRYAHNFCEDEVRALASHIEGFEIADIYCADGKDSRSNIYLLLRRV